MNIQANFRKYMKASFMKHNQVPTYIDLYMHYLCISDINKSTKISKPKFIIFIYYMLHLYIIYNILA